MNICGGIILWGHFAPRPRRSGRGAHQNGCPQFGIVVQGRRKLRPCTLCLIGPPSPFIRHWRREISAPLRESRMERGGRKETGLLLRRQWNGGASRFSIFWGGRSAYLSRSSRAGRGFFRRPFPPDPEPPPGRPFSGWGAKGRTDKAVYAYRRDPPGNPE